MVERKRTFESAMQRLEELVVRLESGDLTLEDSLQAFEEGMALTACCRGQLEAAETRLQHLVRNSDGALQLTIPES